MPNRIREETDDALILDTDVSDDIIRGIICIIVGVLIYVFVSRSDKLVFWFFVLSFFLFAGFSFLHGLSHEDERIIVSKKSQNVAIDGGESIKEIPFSNIEKIEIERHTDPESSDSWSVNIITIQGYSTKIFEVSDESYAERVAEKISKMTA